MASLWKSVNEKVCHFQLYEVNKITTSVVKDAAEKLSVSKSDPIYSY